MYNYRISGLSVSSQMELPGAIATPAHGGGAEVTVRFAPVPKGLDGTTACGPTWDMDGETFLLRVPRLARFLISGGSDICVELESGATARDASGFVLGTSIGILLHQRGALVLHGSAVAKDGRAAAICGHSGAGKSTLAAALCRAGLEFVTDDICVVSLDAERRPVILPDGRQLKLWRESIDRLDLAARQGEAVRESFHKYFIEPHASAAVASRLSAIYVLREARPPMQAGIESLALPDAMRMLEYEAYRPGLRAKLGSKPEMLALAARVLGHAKAFRLTQTRGFEHMEETVARLRKHWEALDP
jgi:energy-coupling factor transporter ATP-binding protein EcfA2